MTQLPTTDSGAPESLPPGSYKWLAFSAIGVSFVTMVMSMSMVFVALSAIADDFGITLRSVTWVVIAEALTISALILPMGRFADIIGWRKVHLSGLALFATGAVLTALAPTFSLLIAARVVMATGNAMGQSVGTAMVVAVFPPSERGMAIGSQTTAVAIGGASGPILAGFMLQVLPWEAMFLILLVPISIAFVAGYFILTDRRLNQFRGEERPPFDWGGAVLSALAIILTVLVINNPLAVSWLSPLIFGGLALVVLLFAAFIKWELRSSSPMFDLRLFRDSVFRLAIITRFLGFMGTTATRFLMPIYLISLRGLEEGAAGAVLFLISFGMGVAAQASGQLSDRFGSRPFAVGGFVIVVATSLPIAFFTAGTPMPWVMAVLFGNGFGMGLWNVPNNSVIMGSVPASKLGVVGAFTNLTRNVGNVTGQALASGIIVAVMAARGFDIPLSEIASSAGASAAFLDGWRVAYVLVVNFSMAGLLLAARTNPSFENEPADEAEPPAEPQVAAGS